ncbi:MAG: O-antigen ligase family protein [Desulfuromonadales bacterium]
MSLLIIVISCLLPIALAIRSPKSLIYYLLYTGALPFGMLFGDDVFTPFGRLNILSLRVLGLIMGCSFVLMVNFNKFMPYWRKWILWALFLLWCAASILWSENYIYGLRMFSKVCAPLIFAGAVIVTNPQESDFKIVEGAIFWNLIVLAIIAVVCKFLGIVSFKGALTVPSHGPAVLAAFLMIPVALASAKIVCGQQRIKWTFVWLVAVACAVGAYARTPLAAEAVGILAIIFCCLPVILRIPFVLLFSFLTTATFLASDYLRHRMFYKNADITLVKLISDPKYVFDHLDTSGRSTLWNMLLKKFYEPDPILGSGLGATESYLHGLESASTAKAVHSEYIRLVCETGLVGLLLFVFAGLVTIFTIYISIDKMPAGLKHIGLTSLALILSYFIFCGSDNAINYVNVQAIYICYYAAIATCLIQRNDNKSLYVNAAEKSAV